MFRCGADADKISVCASLNATIVADTRVPGQCRCSQTRTFFVQGIEEALGSFEAQQARGAWANELCESYYAANARNPDGKWPSESARKSDIKLRDMLAVPFDSGAKLREARRVRARASKLGVAAMSGTEEEAEDTIE